MNEIVTLAESLIPLISELRHTTDGVHGHDACTRDAGTTALYVDCPLERSIRDLQTMERHIAAQPISAG